MTQIGEFFDRQGMISVTKLLQDRKVIENVLLSGISKVLIVMTTLYFMRLGIEQLNKNQFGLWLTLYSLVNWMNLFDLGFGNGLRNSLTKSIENGDVKRSKMLVSTTYLVLSLVFGVISLISIVGSIFLGEQYFHLKPQVLLVFNIVFVGNCLLFVFRLIHVPFQSTHRTYVPDAINAAVQIIVVAVIKISKVGDLVTFGWINILVPIGIYFLITLFFFSKEFKPFAPSIRSFHKSSLKEIATVSIGFFVIQVIGIIIFSSDNFIISFFLGFEAVTSYNVLFRYYAVLTVAFGVIVSPYWSLSASAVSKGDFFWITRSIRILNVICGGIGFLALLMVFGAEIIISSWLGTESEITAQSLLLMMAYVIVMNFAAVYNTINYGIGNILPIVKVSVGGVVINLLVKVLSLKYGNLGIDGIIIANLVYAVMASLVSRGSLIRRLRVNMKLALDTTK